MAKVWQQRIKHFDRALKPLDGMRLRKHARLRTLRERQCRPSRALPVELVFERLALNRSQEGTSQSELARRRAMLELKATRTRLLEGKLQARARIRARRVSKRTSGINLWRRRLAYLAEIEALGSLAHQGAARHHTR